MFPAPIDNSPDPVDPSMVNDLICYLRIAYEDDLSAILNARDLYRYYAVQVDTLTLIYECPWIGAHVTYIYTDEAANLLKLAFRILLIEAAEKHNRAFRAGWESKEVFAKSNLDILFVNPPPLPEIVSNQLHDLGL